MRRLFWLAVAAGVLFIAVYFGSPYLAWRQLRDAARGSDPAALALMIDFPQVRHGLKRQLGAMFSTRIKADPRLAQNPFARLGAQLLPMLIDKIVDAYLTPQSIAVMVAEARAPAKPDEAVPLGTPPKLETHYAYETIDRVRVTAARPTRPDLALGFVLERHGLFTWRLVSIELPPKLLR